MHVDAIVINRHVSTHLGVYEHHNTHVQHTDSSGGRCYGQFYNLCGLFIKGNVMYVADSWNHRIQKLTTGEQFLEKFGQHGSGHYGREC